MITTWMFCWARPAALQDRLGVFAQQLLDLGVADDRRAAAARAAPAPGAAADSQWLAASASAAATAIGRDGGLRARSAGSAKVMRILKFQARGPCRPPSAGSSPIIDNTSVCRAHPAWNRPHCAVPGKLIPRSRPRRMATEAAECGNSGAGAAPVTDG